MTFVAAYPHSSSARRTHILRINSPVMGKPASPGSRALCGARPKAWGDIYGLEQATRDRLCPRCVLKLPSGLPEQRIAPPDKYAASRAKYWHANGSSDRHWEKRWIPDLRDSRHSRPPTKGDVTRLRSLALQLGSAAQRLREHAEYTPLSDQSMQAISIVLDEIRAAQSAVESQAADLATQLRKRGISVRG